MAAYYNEIDPKAAAWLEELIRRDLIAPGVVDTRSIADVRPTDLDGFTQCHFFAGIGGWSYALRLAGWPDDLPVWTGSRPCQPYSKHGRRLGDADPRNLWPEFRRLIGERRPAVCLGEQAAERGGREWLAGVRADLEAMGYAVGAADLCAAGVAAPHIRQRIYWVADAPGAGLEGRLPESGGAQRPAPERGGPVRPYGDYYRLRLGDASTRRVESGLFPLASGVSDCLARMRDIELRAYEEVIRFGEATERNPDEVLRMVRDAVRKEEGREGQSVGMRLEFHEAQILLDFLFCVEAARDGSADRAGVKKACREAQFRIVRSLWGNVGNLRPPCRRGSDEQLHGQSANPLLELSLVLARHAAAYREAASDAHAVSCRVTSLRGYGNAIVPTLAAEFIRAYAEARREILDDFA